jgi:hypothetical protein
MRRQPNDDPARRGIGRFGAALNQGVLAQIAGWCGHPELGKLISRLNTFDKRQPFLDTYAEIMVARRLVRHRCVLCVGVTTPSGKEADFEATRGAVRFYVHVKKLNLDDITRCLYRIADSTDVLERIGRDVKFEVHVLGAEATEKEIKEFPRQLKEFGRSEPIGATLKLPDERSPVLRVRILPKGRNAWPKRTLSFPRYPGPWMRDRRRFATKLRDAYDQFMPEAVNLIAVTANCAADKEDFKRALDDFWSQEKHSASVAGAFFSFLPEDNEFTSHLCLRDAESLNQETTQLLREVFDDQRGGSGTTPGE